MAETEDAVVPVTEQAVKSQGADGQKNEEMQVEMTQTATETSPKGSSPPEKEGESKVENNLDEELKAGSATKNGRRKSRRKAKGGRHHRKPYKPYCKLSWEEKKKRDEKETVRATKKRDDRFASGLPMAPYNTTQFLMEDQDQPSPQAQGLDDSRERQSHRDDASGSYESSDGEYYDSPNDEDTFLVKEFSEAYESFHAERLQQLTKEELVKEYIELEAKNEKLEKKVKQLRNESRSSSDREQNSRFGSDEALHQSQVDGIEAEMKKMKENNAKLSRENEFLKAAAGKLSVEKE